MYSQVPDKNLAVSYYLKAVNSGKDPEAMNCLGLIYEQGLGLDIDASRSIEDDPLLGI